MDQETDFLKAAENLNGVRPIYGIEGQESGRDEEEEYEEKSEDAEDAPGIASGEKGIEDDESVSLSGDSGGKAELLRLLEATKQPVILACNDVMGLWGRSSSNWRNTKDRFSRHLLTVTFDRVSDEALRRIARRVLRQESIDYTNEAIDALIKGNHGDLRALVRDLQVLSSGGLQKLESDMVLQHLEAGVRDMTMTALVTATATTAAVMVTANVKEPHAIRCDGSGHGNGDGKG